MATTISSTSSSTATTATTSTTKTSSTSSVNQSAANSVLTSLGSGSGVDTGALVTQLVDAQFAQKRAQLTSKSDTLTAQISGVATLKSTISDFTKALENLVEGGTLATQPNSSMSGVATASAVPGSSASGLNSSVTVNALATAQIATSAKIASPSAATFGTGTLTLTLGTATTSGGAMTGFTAGTNADGSAKSFAIAIDSSNNSLSGIAAAINAKKAGVTATVINDADGGAYLSLKGTTGAAQAFTLAASDSTSALAQFDTGFGTTNKTTVSSQAGNARLVVDGVAVERGSNEVSDLIAGVKLSLTGTGTTNLTSTRPDSALSSAVKDFVDTYNQVLGVVKEQTDAINGQLRADPAAKTLLRTLQGLTSRVLLPGAATGTPSTLAAIGVRTTRTGELEVDDNALTSAMKNAPEAVEAMFAKSSSGATGLYAAMKSLDLNTGSTIYGLGASSKRFLQAQSDLGKQKSNVDDQATKMTTRLTQQFSSMNARVSAYKATQSFMQQQIDNWTKSTG